MHNWIGPASFIFGLASIWDDLSLLLAEGRRGLGGGTSSDPLRADTGLSPCAFFLFCGDGSITRVYCCSRNNGFKFTLNPTRTACSWDVLGGPSCHLGTPPKTLRLLPRAGPCQAQRRNGGSITFPAPFSASPRIIPPTHLPVWPIRL